MLIHDAPGDQEYVVTPMKRIDASEILSTPLDVLTQAIDVLNGGEAFVDDLLAALNDAAQQGDPLQEKAVLRRVIEALRRTTSSATRRKRSMALFDCGLQCHRLGLSAEAIPAIEHALSLAEGVGDKPLIRRCHVALGVFHKECLDFEASLKHFDRALLMSRELNDRTLEAATLANIGAAFIDMGLYRDAMHINETVLSHTLEGPHARPLRLQCITNNLACAFRLRDYKATARYMSAGHRISEREQIDPIAAAMFEHYRCLQLVRENQALLAKQFIDAARNAIALSVHPRAETLLSIAAGVCEVSLGRVDIGMTRLRALYEKTRTNHLYHDDVLRALAEACEQAGDTTRALAYTEELIEFMTHAKKAKYVDQMTAASKLVPVDASTHDELQQTEADAAALRLQGVREMTSEYRTAENWAVVAELVEDESGEHCFRVGRLSSLLARELGCDASFVNQIEYAARLHDLGKVGISHAILLKPGRLTPHEFAIVRTHTAIGAELLEGHKDPVLQLAAQIARHHHEWWNGNGYPDGLSGEAIPLAARIVALADVYDSLTHDRPYRRAWSHQEAVAEIIAQQGAHFDPHLCTAFLRVLDQYRRSGSSYAGDFHRLSQESALLVVRERLAAAIG